MIGSDIDVQRDGPLPIADLSVWRRGKNGGGIDDHVQPAVHLNRFTERVTDRFTFADVDGYGESSLFSVELLNFSGDGLGCGKG